MMITKQLFFLVFLLMRWDLVGFAQQSSSTPSAPLETPENLPIPAQVNADQSITFRIWAPKATTVEVDGDFPPLPRSVDSYPLTKDSKGIWSVTLGPFEPEIWSYGFIIDGVEMPEAYIEVPGDQPQFYDPKPGEYGTIHINSYKSKTIGLERKIYVYTPPGYDQGNQRYPVLYLLHPSGYTESSWLTIGKTDVIFDNLINEGKAKPMVVVMPFGFPTASLEPGQTPEDSTRNDSLFANDLFEDVIPLTERVYRVSNKQKDRAMAGASMGGLQALTIGLSHTDIFGWFGSFSGLGALGPNANLEKTFESLLHNRNNAQQSIYLLWFAAGEKEKKVLKLNQQFSDLLNNYKIRHTFVPYKEWAHVWQLWRRSLYEFTQLLFK